MKIAAFGEIMLRLGVPDHKLLTQTNHLEALYTGTGYNILAQSAKWGNECYMVTSLPNNNIGKAAKASLKALGIKDDYIHYHHDTIGIYFLESGYGARPSLVTYMGRKNSAFSLSKEENYQFDAILQEVEVLHICGICFALNDTIRDIAIELARKAKEYGILVCFDFNYRASLWENKSYEEARKQYERILPYCDVVFAGSKDATLILGIQEEGLKNQVKEMIRRYGIKIIAGSIREGKEYQGYLCDDQGFYLSNKYELEVLDRIGAGDGFASGIIEGICQEEDPRRIVEFACVCGVLAHTIYGDSPLVELSDIERLMNNEKTDLIR